ncbi:HEL022Cp [Eremothecium sinecaudum]|uniref:HEL022Cp n=1 Tax=Eremothecium sinecaudum TaxID=45286 RepID=A0A109UZS6_9SACH|nr:HEL022Cp [Eremothecium sinecaudum]AMD21258.1 HEL022Cp [Eremothecium sinecaudum]
MVRLSGLQRDVLHLYRRSIRIAYTKSASTTPHFIKFARSEFDKYRNISRKEFSTIEHLLRVGNKRLDLYSSHELKDIH